MGPTQESRSSIYGGHLESSRHKTLKKFIAEHPERLGLPARLAPGKIEYSLKSGDVLDIFFQNGKDQIAVEIKSSISNNAAIVRGIFQCIKYRAVLEAEQVTAGITPSARAILVHEASFPNDLLFVKNILGVELFDRVAPVKTP